MGFNCTNSTCCFSCFYKRCLCFRGGCCFGGRNKTSPDDPINSPRPSIALTTCSRSLADDASIQEQLSLFHFGQHSASSGRRVSHPNQTKWVEEYERRKSQPSSPGPSMMTMNVEENGDPLPPDDDVVPREPPESPIMQYPIIPPGTVQSVNSYQNTPQHPLQSSI